jgi:hypothetical protein
MPAEQVQPDAAGAHGLDPEPPVEHVEVGAAHGHVGIEHGLGDGFGSDLDREAESTLRVPLGDRLVEAQAAPEGGFAQAAHAVAVERGLERLRDADAMEEGGG